MKGKWSNKKRKAERSAFLQVAYSFYAKMKIIKKGQTDPVYSVYTNRAFERIELLVQSWETKSHRVCHFLIILLKSSKYNINIRVLYGKSQRLLLPCFIFNKKACRWSRFLRLIDKQRTRTVQGPVLFMLYHHPSYPPNNDITLFCWFLSLQ